MIVLWRYTGRVVRYLKIGWAHNLKIQYSDELVDPDINLTMWREPGKPRSPLLHHLPDTNRVPTDEAAGKLGAFRSHFLPPKSIFGRCQIIPVSKINYKSCTAPLRLHLGGTAEIME